MRSRFRAGSARRVRAQPPGRPGRPWLVGFGFGAISGCERPVPRWSTRITSRSRSMPRNAAATCGNASSADWPGPPASITTGSGCDCLPDAAMRATAGRSARPSGRLRSSRHPQRPHCAATVWAGPAWASVQGFECQRAASDFAALRGRSPHGPAKSRASGRSRDTASTERSDAPVLSCSVMRLARRVVQSLQRTLARPRRVLATGFG